MEALRDKAFRLLTGVGDADIGEWETPAEWTPYAPGNRVYHVKRRLTPAEVEHVGEPRDIRGTPEMYRRLDVVALRTNMSVAELLRLEPVLLKP